MTFDWGVILSVGLQILGWVLKRASVSDESKQKFFEFVRKAADDMGSVKLHKYGDDQLKWLAENPWKETT